MPLFELDQGRLVPAQFGRPVERGFSADVLESVRAQVLEVISRPLFPVAWDNDEADEVSAPPYRPGRVRAGSGRGSAGPSGCHFSYCGTV